MYVRLAFAVAAHLEPEILVVDEVLAVGDASFQKKCLGKIKDVSGEGRTVLFVSHNMGVLQELCELGIWLNEGKIKYNGITSNCIQKYLSMGIETDYASADLSNHRNRLRGMSQILENVSIQNPGELPKKDFTQHEILQIQVRYSCPHNNSLAGAGFNIRTTDGIQVGGFNTYMAFPPPHKIPKSGKIEFNVACSQFTPGQYLLTVSLGSHQGALADKIEDCIEFSISQSDIYGTGYLLTKEDGVAALRASVHVHSLDNQ